MNKAVQFFKDWMLPLAIATGIGLYLFYHFTPVLKPYGAVLHKAASEGQRFVIALLLFFQFVQISPHDVRPRRWHLGALLVQILGFFLFAGLSAVTPDGAARILLECAMICLICPCAAAAGVITRKLDGDLAATVSYLCLTNLAATFLIPMVIPMIRPASNLGFWAYVFRIAMKVFPVLILPGLVAWTIRYTTHKLQRRLMRFAPNSFYIWFIGLSLAMLLATHALFMNYPGGWALAGIEGPRELHHRRPGPRPEEHRLPHLAGIQLFNPRDFRRRGSLCHLAEPVQQLGTLPARTQKRWPVKPAMTKRGHSGLDPESISSD